jgi:sec-independent protein translocase protein TatA
MGTFSIWHLLILMVFALLLFGRGKISELMGDVAKGIKSFKKGMADDDVAQTPPKPGEQGKIIDAHATKATDPVNSSTKTS